MRSLITQQPGARATVYVPLTRRPDCLEMHFQVQRECQTLFTLCQQDCGLSVTQSCSCQQPFACYMCVLGCNVNTQNHCRHFLSATVGWFFNALSTSSPSVSLSPSETEWHSVERTACASSALTHSSSQMNRSKSMDPAVSPASASLCPFCLGPPDATLRWV